jgi:hypothetical protein
VVVDDVLGILDEAIQPRPVPLKQNSGKGSAEPGGKIRIFEPGA